MTARAAATAVDLTQDRPRVAVASASDAISRLDADLPRRAPVVILPYHAGEPPIAGPEAAMHRRGSGISWPPEAQAPLDDDPARGVGRLPLVCAWAALAPTESDGGGWSAKAAADASWRPSQDLSLSLAPARAIALSAERLGARADAPVGLVVPDSLGESAQQLLLDAASRLVLVPRPVAVALEWCARHRGHFERAASEDEEGWPVGHVRVVTLGLDGWEAAVVAVRARRFGGETLLVPVRRRLPDGCELPWWGISLVLGALGAKEPSPAGLWRGAFAEERTLEAVEALCASVSAGDPLTRQVVSEGWSRAIRSHFGRWPVMAPLLAQGRGDPGGMQAAIEGTLARQLDGLPRGAGPHLATLVDGALVRVRCGGRPLGELAREAAGGSGPFDGTMDDGGAAASGAALALAARLSGRPSYRDTLVPVEIHSHGRNELGDRETRWTPLVPAETVEAGREFRSPEPLRGLQIRHGERFLTLTLRRPGRSGHAYRQVQADLPKATVRDEPVTLDAAVRPGQGFAKVRVDSETAGVFSTELNWRSMRTCDKPPDPTLGYLPRISYIVPDRRMWEDSLPFIIAATDALKNPRAPLTELLRRLTDRLNKWPLAHGVDRRRGHGRPDVDLYRHYGVVGSDGSLAEGADTARFAALREALADRFRLERNSKICKRIQRTAAWLYLGMPGAIQRDLVARVTRGATIEAEDIHAMGLTWEAPDKLAIFFRRLEANVRDGAAGMNEWLRALRNIVQLREHALDPECVDGVRLLSIVSSITTVLELEMQRCNLQRRFNNCLRASFFVLKRRRYEDGFLSPDGPEGSRLRRALDRIVRLPCTERQRRFAEAASKFLLWTATEADLAGVLEESDDGGEDDDE